ncbi:hypothetical protein BKA70DRAFT_1400700 [Coprinopsis sp. MPI-PUGE-AT-0042]|nr:hypothetical protein BKA70DRAFT_1400700 [Coprinopsis sp. MPI-PUGE-AT-0042]
MPLGTLVWQEGDDGAGAEGCRTMVSDGAALSLLPMFPCGYRLVTRRAMGVNGRTKQERNEAFCRGFGLFPIRKPAKNNTSCTGLSIDIRKDSSRGQTGHRSRTSAGQSPDGRNTARRGQTPGGRMSGYDTLGLNHLTSPHLRRGVLLYEGGQ